MTRTRFHQGLEELKQRLLIMGGLAEQAVDRAIHGYVTRDLEICRRVLEDEKVINASEREIDEMGIGCEPASATTLAGVKKLRAAGVMKDGDRIVCVLTGNLLKDTDAILRNVPAERTIEIEATIDAVERALG